MTRPRFASYGSLVLVACGLIGAGCAHDTYQERANLIKNHADAFYDSLKTNRVESAIRDNEQIEAMASQMETPSENGPSNKAPQRSNGNLP